MRPPLLLLLPALALSGCAHALVVEAAPHASDPDCARVMLAAPPTLGGLPARGTTSQATEAWGEEFPIVVRCGVEIPSPTTDHCVGVLVNSYAVDWVITERKDEWVATTYGRRPAVEAIIPKARADQALGDLLAELTPAASLAPLTGRSCVGPGD